MAELPGAARDGYTFEGWFTAAEGGDAVTADTVFDKDTTVFAHWKKNVVSATPSVKLSTSAYTYNGKVKTPGVKVSVNGTVLTKDNYSVSYGKGRKNVGKYTVKVTLKNDYAGSKTVSFKITPELLRFYDYDLNHVAEPGDFDVMIGGSSQAEKIARLTLK